MLKKLTALCSVLACSNLFGLGIEFGYHDPEVVARGNAGVASATGSSAVYYNPALLAISPEADVSISTYILDYDFEYSGPNSYDAIGGTPAVAASAFAMIPITDDSALGIGLYSPFGQKNEWSEASPVRNLALDTELIYLAGTVAYGFQATPDLHLGISASAVQSSASLNRGLLAPGDRFSLDGSGYGWGLGAGFTWEPIERHRLAGSVRWWSPVSYEGEILTRSPAGAAVSPAQTRLDFPVEWTIGYAWLPCDEWVVELDVIYTEWSSFDQLTVRTPGGPIAEPLLWNDSFKVALGATRYWDSGWWLGFGYWYAETTGPDVTFNPRLPDLNLHVLSLGVGFRAARWAAEFAYQFGYGNSRNITTAAALPPSGVNANGKYTYNNGHGFTLGLSCFW